MLSAYLNVFQRLPSVVYRTLLVDLKLVLLSPQAFIVGSDLLLPSTEPS
jgi:hypothetical protein